MRAQPAGGLTPADDRRQAVSLSLFRFPTAYAKHWALWQMLLARPKLRRLPGVQFMKMVGAGSREGFFPWPNFGVYGVLAAWPSLDHARAQVNGAEVFRRYRDHASEHVTLYLHPTRSRGAWAGVAPFDVRTEDDRAAPLAVLTRATIRPARALAFWSRTPGIRAAIPDSPALALRAGLGEVPWLNQITFTVWTDRAALRAFAADPAGPHGRAAEAARRLGWFREELFARFRIAAVEGAWAGFDAAALTPRPIAA
jgi:spheroidene monooxygenase